MVKLVEISEPDACSKLSWEARKHHKEECSVSGFLKCSICLKFVSTFQLFQNNTRCFDHFYCSDCIHIHITAKLQDFKLDVIKCPVLYCNEVLDPMECRSILAPSTFENWCDSLCESSVKQFKEAYCPYCSALILSECEPSATLSCCPMCKKFFCFSCEKSWHAGYTCGQTHGMVGDLMARNKSPRCPICNHRVEHEPGCSIVKCRKNIASVLALRRQEKSVTNLQSDSEKGYSDLPDEILLQIFARVPIWDVVRTTVLSKGWCDKWKITQEVILYDSEAAPYKRGSFVGDLLVSLLDAPIRKRYPVLKLIINEGYLNTEYNFRLWNEWVDCLSDSKKLETLVLILPKASVCHEINHLDKCKGLKHLVLKNLALSFQIPTVFPKLLSVTLNEVLVTSEMLGLLINGSPRLKFLSLNQCIGDISVIISGSNLQRFYYWLGDCEIINIIDSPQLEVVTVCLQPRRGKNAIKFSVDVRGIANVKYLYCFKCFVELLSEAKGLDLLKFPPQLHRLSHLYIMLDPGNKSETEFTKLLLRMAPVLEYLDVKSFSSGDAHDRFWTRSPAGKLFPLLQSFAVSMFQGDDSELQFLEFVVRNTSVKCKLTIALHPSLDCTAKLEVVERVSALTLPVKATYFECPAAN